MKSSWLALLKGWAVEEVVAWLGIKGARAYLTCQPKVFRSGQSARSRSWAFQPLGWISQPSNTLLSSPGTLLSQVGAQLSLLSRTTPFPPLQEPLCLFWFHSFIALITMWNFIVCLWGLFFYFYFLVPLPLELKPLNGQTFVYFNLYAYLHRTDNILYLVVKHNEVTG